MNGILFLGGVFVFLGGANRFVSVFTHPNN